MEQDTRLTRPLFATAAELGVPPVPYFDGDLSRIQVTAPTSLSDYERLHAERERARAERQAKRDQAEGIGELARLVAAG